MRTFLRRAGLRWRGAAVTATAATVALTLVTTLPGWADPTAPTTQPLSSPAGSPSDSIAAKQAQAKRIAATLEVQGEKISVLAEQYDQAVIEVDRSATALVAAQKHEGTAAEAAELAKAKVRRSAIDAYVRAGQIDSFVPTAGATSVDEALLRRRYASSVIDTQKQAVEGLRVALRLLAAERAKVETAAAQARTAVSRVQSERKATESAVASQKRLLASVQGELVDLVAAEQQRRADVELAAAATRQAQAQAAAALPGAGLSPTSTGRPPGGTGGPPPTGPAGSRPTTTAGPTPTRPGTPTTTRPPAPTTVVTGPPGGGSSTPTTGPRSTTTTTRPTDGGPPPPSSRAATAVAMAKAQIGDPYEWGAAGPDSFDCSGLTSYAWAAAGRYLPHSSAAQFAMLPRVSISEIAPGDLLFFGSPVHHVGIYAGGGLMVEAPHTGVNVQLGPAFRSDLVGIGRP